MRDRDSFGGNAPQPTSNRTLEKGKTSRVELFSGNVEGATKRIMNVAHNLNELASSLAGDGGTSPAGQAEGPRPGRSGSLGMLEDRLDELQGALDQLDFALNRLREIDP